MEKKYRWTRRELVKQFGLAGFFLFPLLRSMRSTGALSSLNAHPRFVNVFRGPCWQSEHVGGISAISNLTGTPLAALQPSASDLILVKNLRITGGSYYSQGYGEEHGIGLVGGITGDLTKYTSNDSYYAYTDKESIDTRIAREYATIPEAQTFFGSLPLVIGGCYADAFGKEEGQNFFSTRNRAAGETGTYANVNPSIEDPQRLYDTMMSQILKSCSTVTNQPITTTSVQRQLAPRAMFAAQPRRSLVDFALKDINDAKRYFGLDSQHSHDLDGMLEGWSAIEKNLQGQAGSPTATPNPTSTPQPSPTATPTPGGGSNASCPTMTPPNQQIPGYRTTASQLASMWQSHNLDSAGPYIDSFIGLIALAFQWDLTRSVALCLGSASNGQRSPARGVSTYHHGLEHGSTAELAQIAIVDAYYAEKFQGLLQALRGVRDPNGQTGLHNSVVVMSTECRSSLNRHSLSQLSWLMAGQGGGKIQTGRVVDAGTRSNNDVWLSALRGCGISATTFGASQFCRGPLV